MEFRNSFDSAFGVVKNEFYEKEKMFKQIMKDTKII